MQIFLGLFCNTGLVSLLVSANLPNLAMTVDGVGLFSGEFSDFSPRWYTVVGVSLVLTMIINTFAPQFGPLFKLFVVLPLKRRCCRNRQPTQESLNKLYEGAQFDVASRYPTNLNTLFVAMAYCTGLPILLPIGVLSFTLSYWIDKVSLLRLYNLPPRYDDALARLSSRLMPWAALFHLFFAVWMLGQNDLLKSEAFTGSFGDADAEARCVCRPVVSMSAHLAGCCHPSTVLLRYDEWKAKVEEWDKLGAVPRIVRLNVLPVFLFALALSVWLLFGSALKVRMRVLWYRAQPSSHSL